jgi:hypothetical protein
MNHQLLYQWESEIGEKLGMLNSWQVANVALFSYGVIAAESCQQETIARKVISGERVTSAARRWRRFLDNEQFPLEAFFEGWSRWVVSALGSQAITLLVDETKVKDRIGSMVVGVAWEGRCIPLAWHSYRANDAEAYPAEGQVKLIERLLRSIKAGLNDDLEVLVLADRGIGTSPELCKAVERLGWYYLFRVTCQTKIITSDQTLTIAQQVQPGDIWAASGIVFKKRGRIPAHARALWSVGYDEPWALVTNDERLTGHEYARRNWQEQAFRDLKSGGWHWGDSRLRHPDHVDRLLVVLALAYAWILGLGSKAVDDHFAHPLTKRPDACVRRAFSLFKEGLLFFVEVLQRASTYLGLIFIPDKRFT